MNVLRDRLLLVGSAAGLVALLLSGAFALQGLGLGESWVDLWLYTVLLFVALLPTAAFEVKRRSKTLRRRWPLVGAVLTFFIGHVLVLSWLLRGVGREWRMPHFYVVSVIEVIVFGLIFEQALRWCVRSNKQIKWKT